MTHRQWTARRTAATAFLALGLVAAAASGVRAQGQPSVEIYGFGMADAIAYALVSLGQRA